MKINGFCFIIFSVTALLLQMANAEESVLLVDKGTPCSVIIVSNQIDPDESLAVEELIENIHKISGSRIPVTKIGSDQIDTELKKVQENQQIPILIGEIAKTGKIEEKILFKGNLPESFIINVDTNIVKVVGLSPRGTLYGIYEMLEQL